MKLEIILATTLLAGCGATICNKDNVGRYRMIFGVIHQCEEYTSSSGEKNYSFKKIETDPARCIRMSEEYTNFEYVDCPEEKRRIGRE